MDAGNVKFLLPKGSSAPARAVASLEVGRALYWGQKAPRRWRGTLGFGEDDALRRAERA